MKRQVAFGILRMCFRLPPIISEPVTGISVKPVSKVLHKSHCGKNLSSNFRWIADLKDKYGCPDETGRTFGRFVFENIEKYLYPHDRFLLQADIVSGSPMPKADEFLFRLLEKTEKWCNYRILKRDWPGEAFILIDNPGG